MSIDELLAKEKKRDLWSMLVPIWGQYRIIQGYNGEWNTSRVWGTAVCTYLNIFELGALYTIGGGIVVNYLQ